MSRQSRYVLASEVANCGTLVMSKVQDASEDEKRSTIEYINEVLTEFQCKRQFGDDVLEKNWDDFTDDDFEGFMSTGYKLNDYVKLWFKQSDVFNSVYIMNKVMPQERLETIVRDIFADKECGDVFRIKGFLPVNDTGWIELNATAKKTEVRPIENGQEIIIVIGSNLVEDKIKRYFE